MNSNKHVDTSCELYLALPLWSPLALNTIADKKTKQYDLDPPSFAFDRNLSTTENFTYEKNSKLENYGRESKEHKGRNFKKGIRKSNASKHAIRKSNAWIHTIRTSNAWIHAIRPSNASKHAIRPSNAWIHAIRTLMRQNTQYARNKKNNNT